MTDAQIDREFEEVWLLWDRKQSKGQARRTYKKWRKSGKLPPKERLILIFTNMQKYRRGWLAGYQPHFSTWLNDEGWLDEQDPAKVKGFWSGGEWIPY